MSVYTRAAAAAASRPLSSLIGSRASRSCLSARHVWLNAPSLHPTSPIAFHSHLGHRPPSPPTRLFSSATASATSAPPTATATTTATPSSASPSPLTAVHSMSDLRNVVHHAGTRLVILQWKATWCGKCKTVTRELERLIGRYPTVVVRSVDIDEGDLIEGKKEAGIEHLPVLHFIKDGELVHEIVGVRTVEMAKTVEKYAGEQVTAAAGSG